MALTTSIPRPRLEFRGSCQRGAIAARLRNGRQIVNQGVLLSPIPNIPLTIRAPPAKRTLHITAKYLPKDRHARSGDRIGRESGDWLDREIVAVAFARNV